MEEVTPAQVDTKKIRCLCRPPTHVPMDPEDTDSGKVPFQKVNKTELTREDRYAVAVGILSSVKHGGDGRPNFTHVAKNYRAGTPNGFEITVTYD